MHKRNPQRSDSATSALEVKPFGYVVGAGPIDPGERVPSPAPGPPILNFPESQFVNEFFHGFTSDQQQDVKEPSTTFIDPKLLNALRNAPLDIPPRFEGVTSSLLSPSSRSSLHSHPTRLRADHGCLARSPTTFSTIANLVSKSHPHDSDHQTIPLDLDTAFTDPINYSGQANVGCPLTFDEMTPINLQLLHGFVEPNSFYNPLTASDNQPLLRSNCIQRSDGGQRFQYGSDPNFGDGRFMPPHHLPTEAGIQNAMARQVESLCFQGNVRATRAPTLTADEPISRLAIEQRTSVDSVTHTSESEEPATPSGKSPQEPTKGSRATAKSRSDGDAAHCSAGKIARRGRKPRGKKHNNLSEEQKDENHRLSEQRRRNVIKRYYSALKATVPAMQTKKTKGDEMEHTVRWIRKSLEENRKLEQRLQIAKRRRVK